MTTNGCKQRKGHSRLWIALAGAVVLLAGHGIILYYVSSHVAVSTAVIAGVIVLAVIKHLGLLGLLCARFGRKVNQRRRGEEIR